MAVALVESCPLGFYPGGSRMRLRTATLLNARSIARMAVALIATISVHAFPSRAAAATYYVATTGSDTDPGSLTQPWRTIQKAANSVAAGDTVYIRGGTYIGRVILATSGTPSARITFRNYQTETAILDGAGISLGNTDALFQIDNRSYITVTGLEIRNSTHTGIRATTGTNLIIENVIVHDSGEHGIAFYNNSVPSNSIVRGCRVYNTSQSGILLWNNNGGYYLIENNEVYNWTGNGNYDGIQGIDTPYVVVKNNTVHDGGPIAGADYIDMGGDQTLPSSNAHHIVYDGNTIYRGSGAANSVKLDDRPRRSIIRKNTIYGIQLTFYEQPDAQVVVYNNSLVQSSGYAVQLWNAETTSNWGGLAFKNNIFAFAGLMLLQHTPNLIDGSYANIKMNNNVYRFSGGGIEWAMSSGVRT